MDPIIKKKDVGFKPVAAFGKDLSLMLIIFGILGILISVHEAGYGVFLNSFHVDGAHHLSIIETMLRGDDPQKRDWMAVLQNYPNLSHWIVAKISKVTSASPLPVMAIMCSFLVFFGAYGFALKFVTIARDVDLRPRATMICVACAILLTSSVVGVGNIAHHFKWNFFFAQLFATVLAIFGQIILFMIKEKFTSIIFIFLFFPILANVHLIGAIWFLGCAVIVLFARENRVLDKFLYSTLLVSLVACYAALDPAIIAMIRIGSGNGGLMFPNLLFGSRVCGDSTHLCNLSDYPEIVGVIGLFTAGLMVVSWSTLGSKWAKERFTDGLLIFSGLISILTMLLVQFCLLVFFDQGSSYGLAKTTFILVPEAAFAVCMIGARKGHWLVSDRPFIILSSLKKIIPTLFVLVMLTLSQRPFSYNPTYSITKLDYQRTELIKKNKNGYLTEGNLYPSFPGNPDWANYYLAIGVLGKTTDEPTRSWYYSRETRDESRIILEGKF